MPNALKLAIKIGVNVAEFWDMTPYILSLIAETYVDRKKEKQELLVTQAWLTACFYRQDKLESLETILDRLDQKEQSVDDMLSMVKSMNAMYGGEIIE